MGFRLPAFTKVMKRRLVQAPRFYYFDVGIANHLLHRGNLVRGTADIKKEYEILLNELRNFNPDMLDKHRVLAVTKCDLLDEELIEMLRETLPDDLPVVFISSVANMGLTELKDILWQELNSESNKLQSITQEDVIVHRDKDMSRFAEEMAAEGEDEDIEYVDDIEDVEDIEDLEDFEYEEGGGDDK